MLSALRGVTERGEVQVEFGKYLEKCLKKHDISLNSAANMLGLNRGDLYHIIDSKRKLKPEAFKNLIESIRFTAEEERKLTKLFYVSFYGESEFEKIEFIIEKLNSFSSSLKTEEQKIGAFDKKFALSDSDEILSAVNHIIIENSEKKIVTNYPFENIKMDALFYSCCKKGEVKKFRHIVNFTNENSAKENLRVLFSALKYFYNKHFLYYYYSDMKVENNSVYPYFVVGEKSAVLFNDKNGIYICDGKAVEDIRQRAEKLVEICNRLGEEMPDIFELKDTYVAAVMNGPDIYEICPIPCLMCYTDKDFFYSICKSGLPNRDFLVNVANDHYSNINKVIRYNQYMTVEGLDFLFKERECLEMPSEYADRIPKQTLKRLFERLYEAVKQGNARILDNKKLNIPTNLQIEITASGALIYGYIFHEGETTEKPFLVVIKDKSLINSFKSLFDYLERGDFVFSKEAALAYVSNRIVSLEY